MPVPEADKGAVARMKYEKDHKRKAWHHRARHPVAEARARHEHRRAFGRSRHDHHAAIGSAAGAASPLAPAARFNGDVTATPVGNSTALDTKPDARANPPAQAMRLLPAPPRLRPLRATAAQPRPQPPTIAATATDPNAKKKKKNKKQQQQPQAARYRISPLAAAARGCAARAAGRSIELSSMSRILLADDSPHAQRMGERILREEGFEVVSLTDGEAAMLRLADVDPDLVIADVFLPGKSGLRALPPRQNEPRFKHVRVVLTAGLLEQFDEEEARRAGCDAILKKPFEASKLSAPSIRW